MIHCTTKAGHIAKFFNHEDFSIRLLIPIEKAYEYTLRRKPFGIFCDVRHSDPDFYIEDDKKRIRKSKNTSNKIRKRPKIDKCVKENFITRDTAIENTPRHIITHILPWEVYDEFYQELEEKNITEEEFFDTRVFNYKCILKNIDLGIVYMRHEVVSLMWPELAKELEILLNKY